MNAFIALPHVCSRWSSLRMCLDEDHLAPAIRGAKDRSARSHHRA